MGALLLRVKCVKCGKLLLEFERGNRSDEIKTQRFGAQVIRTGLARCEKCGGETAFDTRYLPKPGA